LLQKGLSWPPGLRSTVGDIYGMWIA
jgi:hypothetical protein